MRRIEIEHSPLAGLGIISAHASGVTTEREAYALAEDVAERVREFDAYIEKIDIPDLPYRESQSR